jgi:hypothetical protein
MPKLETLSLFAAVCSAIAAGTSAYVATQARKQVQTSEVRQSQQVYLGAYREARNKIDYAVMSTVDAYNRASPNEQSQIQIVEGLLVSVVDTMYQTGDAHAPMWAEYIKSIPGPLVQSGFELEGFAADPRTIAAIDKARQTIRATQSAK